jgi:hypothetical protein
MQRYFKIILVIWFACAAMAARADVCAICGQEIHGTVYLVTDKVTGEQVEVCSNCIQLPRCYICDLPVKDGMQLPDGRWLCTRDAKDVILDTSAIDSTFDEVHDDLDRLFSRYTTFPTNVDERAFDLVDVDSIMDNNSVENSDVLGVTEPYTAGDGHKRYKIGLLTGQPPARLREVCAHELSHAWVGENVPEERHARLARDAEEGFCEMMGYLLMDSENEEGEKKRVLANSYTRGQVNLFVEAEQEYGFDAILDWMQYGVTDRLEDGHLDEVKDVKMPANTATANTVVQNTRAVVSWAAPTTIQLQGILWSGVPSAIINAHLFFAGDEFKVSVGNAKVTIRCLSIEKSSVRIQDVDTGKEQDLSLSKN